MNPDRYISHGFYRVTDREAKALAKDAGSNVPGAGMELRVQLPDGSLAWLSRTPYSQGHTDAPKRGWVYAVSGITKPDKGRIRSASKRPV